MPALDTNVLVRFLVRDDADQHQAAQQLIARCVTAAQVLHIPITVVLELEWVLRSRYGFAKAAITQAIAGLLASKELSFDTEAAIEWALHDYCQSGADFADCLHAALAAHAGQAPLWTFDKAAAKLNGASLLA